MKTKAFWLVLVALGLGTKRHWHILVAILLGVMLGIYLPYPPSTTDPDQFFFIHQFFDIVGQLFIRLITMIVVPLVVSSLIVGVSSLGDSRQLGRMGGKVLVYFLVLMSLSALLGGFLAWMLEPGTQLHHSLFAQTDPTSILQQLQNTPQDLRQLFFDMIPRNPVESLARADLVPVILFTLLFGGAVASIGDAGRPIVSFFEALFSATMKLTDWVMIFAVPGVFSLAFVTVAKSGLDVFSELWLYGVAILGGLLIQVFVIFPILLRVLAKINFMNLYRAISEAIMVAFGTASSSATLPITIACMERRAGVSNRIASFVLPTGATINKTGTTMFEVIAVIFLAQAYHLPLSPYHIGMIIVFSIIASIGAAGVPSAGLITMAIVLNALGHINVELFAGGMALIWSIDRVLDMCRTAVNVISSCTVAALVASSEGELNRDILNNRDVWTEVV
ncbi:MAG TPA: dicarboxylate/amino acid:cation symporter [Coleofasciculaceae cyanobacterium]|jgi:Na+/H+-dicarboxylate symporter